MRLLILLRDRACWKRDSYSVGTVEVESPIHKSRRRRRRREHLTDKGGIGKLVLSFFFGVKSCVLYLSYTTILRVSAAYENL
jgi:hypothetical protein